MATPPPRSNNLRKQLIEAYKAGLRRALMLTEKRNVPGVRDLINKMVTAGFHSPADFKEAVMNFLSTFSEHIGEKYNLRAYSGFLKELSYHKDLIGKHPYSPRWEEKAEDIEAELQLEQGMYNALAALNCFFVYLAGKVGIDRQTPQDEPEDDFLFTAIREARNLRKEYIDHVNGLISEVQREYSIFPNRFDSFDEFVHELEFRKGDVEDYNFDSNSLVARQKERKKNELYGSGARTNQPLNLRKVDIDDEKQFDNLMKNLDDVTASRKDPWNRVGKFKLTQKPRAKTKGN